MNNEELFHEDLNFCPICNEDVAYVETENDYWAYVICAHCGSRTVTATYRTPAEKVTAIKQVAHLWNIGKVIAERRGE